MLEGWPLMARSRNIKPGFFVNEKLVEQPFETRLMFIGLWTLADREGRLEDRPLRIKMSLFPADSVDTDAMLQQLHDAGFIQRYEVDDREYIEVTAFKKHQNPHVKESPSVIPAPDMHRTSTGHAPDEHQTSPADSLNLIPDSLISDSDTPDDSGEDEREDYPSKPSAQERRFEQFWSAYPKKVNKGAARKSWQRIKPSEQLVETMVESIARHKTWEQWTKDNGRFIPNPATWLNADGWLNEVGNVTPIRKPDSEKTERDRIQDELRRYDEDVMLDYGDRATKIYALMRRLKELDAQEQVS